jgi:nucleoside-diphosphate kinase
MMEQRGFVITYLENRYLTPEEAEQLYQEHKGTEKYPELIARMLSGPVALMKIEYTGQKYAWSEWRNCIGVTDPSKAAIGTIRYNFGQNVQNNAVHGSDSEESAKRELGIFFRN